MRARDHVIFAQESRDAYPFVFWRCFRGLCVAGRCLTLSNRSPAAGFIVWVLLEPATLRSCRLHVSYIPPKSVDLGTNDERPMSRTGHGTLEDQVKPQSHETRHPITYQLTMTAYLGRGYQDLPIMKYPTGLTCWPDVNGGS